MTRRLEGTRLGTASVDTSGVRIQHAETPELESVSRKRPLRVNKPPTSPSHADSLQASERSFRPDAGNGRSLDEALLDFVMPRVTEPAILKRSASILQACISELVPHLNGGTQLRELATSLMTDEIERHRELLGRMREGAET